VSQNWFSRLLNRGRIAPQNPRVSSSFSAESAAGGGAGVAFWPMSLVPPELRLTPDEMVSTSTVWACLRALVDPIASSEVRVLTREAGGGRKYLDDDLVAYLLNVRPSPDFTAQAFKEIILSQTIIYGDGYAEIVRDGAGRVVELWPLQSEYMYLLRDEETDELLYRYRQPGDQEIVYLRARDVLHVRGPSVLGLTGDSLIWRAAKAVALHVAQEKFATSYFANGTVLGGFVKFPTGISPETKDRLKADFRRRYGGHKHAHGIAFLESGMEYQAIGANSDQSQLVPSRAFSVEEIARYFGVPLVRLGVQAAAQGYGTNVAQLNLGFVQDTLTPWVNRLCEEAAYKLFPQKAPWRQLEIDTTWLTQGDAEQRARANEINIRSGILTVNEARETEGKNSIGAPGDLHLVASNLVVLDEENLKRPEPPAPAPPPPEDEEDPEVESDDGEAMAQLAAAIDRYGRSVRARTANLAKSGKAPDEIARNVASTLRPKAIAAIVEAIEAVSLPIPEPVGDTGSGAEE
jgi:HK97 family phage portal protein